MFLDREHHTPWRFYVISVTVNLIFLPHAIVNVSVHFRKIALIVDIVSDRDSYRIEFHVALRNSCIFWSFGSDYGPSIWIVNMWTMR